MSPPQPVTPPPGAPPPPTTWEPGEGERQSGRRWLRRLVLWGGGTVLVVVAVIAGILTLAYSRADLDTAGSVKFINELHIPPVHEPEIDDDGRLVFDLDLQEGTTEFIEGISTETWGVNGSYLGPTLRAERGDEVLINVDNGLPEATTVHWHGMHLPAAADGNPHQLIDVGDTWSPTWQINQPAATLWYHPHPHGLTADHVYQGVAGMFILDEPATTPDGLPDTYGVDDIPVIIQDKRFRDDGALDPGTNSFATVGQLGDEMLVNGTHSPYLDVTTQRVRLRVLNASNGRTYNLQFDDQRPFTLIGTDGGLLTEPVELTSLKVSPAERVEIVVALTPGERVVLRSDSPALGLDSVNDRFSGGDDRFDLLELRAADDLAPSPELPARLADDELPDPDDAVATRKFSLEGSSRISGEKMDPSRIDTVVAVDTTEIWEVTNASGNPHNFHVHDVQFRVIEYDGDPPPPHLTGPKDTVFIAPSTSVRLAVSFADYTDPTTPYMYHCHLLLHEDNGMMAQFTVVAPDEVEDAPRHIETHLGHE